MKSVSMGDKIELTALQLLYLLNDTIEAAFKRAKTGRKLDTLLLAQQKTIDIFRRKRATISKQERDV